MNKNIVTFVCVYITHLTVEKLFIRRTQVGADMLAALRKSAMNDLADKRLHG